MKKIIATAALFLCFGIYLQAQQIIEKSIPLKENQKAILDLKFAEDIRVENWDKNELFIKAEVNINNNTLNEAHTMNISNNEGAIQIETGFDEEILKNSKKTNCKENGSHQSNLNGKEGYSICSSIKYTVFLPSETDLKIETISGNILLEDRSGSLEAKSISGFVDLSSAPDKKADFRLKSISGEVYTDLDIEIANRQDNPIVGYELKGKLNGGGEIVDLESISGNVYVRKGD